MNKLRKATEMLEITKAYHKDIEIRIIKPFVDLILEDIIELIETDANKGFYSTIFKYDFPKQTKEDIKKEKYSITKYLKDLLEEYGYFISIHTDFSNPVDICLYIEWGKDE